VNDRVEALHKRLDHVFETMRDKPFSVRVYFGDKLISMMGNNMFDPSTLYFKVLPELVESKIVMLRMLRGGEGIPDVGRRHSQDTFYISLTPRQWESFKDEAIPMLR
jgi:hypothetical protein